MCLGVEEPSSLRAVIEAGGMLGKPGRVRVPSSNLRAVLWCEGLTPRLAARPPQMTRKGVLCLHIDCTGGRGVSGLLSNPLI